MAGRIAGAIRETGRVLLLGMGASHAAGRAVEPLYRALGVDALALPLSEQLYAPLPVGGRDGDADLAVRAKAPRCCAGCRAGRCQQRPSSG